MVYGYGDLNYNDRFSLRIAIIRRTKGKRGFDRGTYVVKRYSSARL